MPIPTPAPILLGSTDSLDGAQLHRFSGWSTFCDFALSLKQLAEIAGDKIRAPMGLQWGEMGKKKLDDCFDFSFFFMVFLGFYGFILFQNG